MSEITPSAAASQAEHLGVYVHVPFCASTCDFCAFYQTEPTAEKVHQFLAGIRSEADMLEWARPAMTIFWGGGTPGLLGPRQLRELGETVLARSGGVAREWSVELAPASVTDARLAVLRELGVTRISMGAQSFQPALLETLGRQHTREQVFRAYERIRAAGFASVNLDLMFALPGQNEADWLADLQQAIALAPDHLSTYCLTFEEDTALWVKLSQGKVKLDPEREARLYERTWAELEGAGYGQYEISNFARKDHACIHNLNTWRMQEWIGLGPSAASQYRGERGANVSDLERWLVDLGRGERAREDRVRLTPELLVEDSLIFGLRMNEGVDLAGLRGRFPLAPWRAVEELADRLVANELAVRAVPLVEEGKPPASGLRLTLKGRLVADAIGSEIMDALSVRHEI